MQNLEQYRSQFPSLKQKAYFNYGGQGPMPQAAIEAIATCYQEIQNLGPFSNAANRWITQAGDQTRAAIAGELNVPSSTITLTEDVSVGCNIGLWGIDWKKGDRLILTDCEHPGIIAAAQEIQRRFQVEIIVCPIQQTLNQGNPVEIIANAVNNQTRLVIISHLLWNTGQVLPQGEISKACKQINPDVKILVDAAQSVGSLALNLIADQIDFYAFTGHKWWCGPEGLGGLYVSSEARASLAPTFIGWRGIVSDTSGYPTGFKDDGKRYEIATSAYPLYSGLQAALKIHQSWGSVAQRYQKICQLSHILWQKLREIPQVTCLRESPPEAGLVSFQLANSQHAKLVQSLEDQQILTRTIRDPDCVRACVHYFSSEAEIEQLVDAIATFCQGKSN